MIDGWPPRMPTWLYTIYIIAETMGSLASRVLNKLVFGGSIFQTTSSRSHIESLEGSEKWDRRRRFINALFVWQKVIGIEDHCEWSWHREVDNARKTIVRAKATNTF